MNNDVSALGVFKFFMKPIAIYAPDILAQAKILIIKLTEKRQELN